MKSSKILISAGILLLSTALFFITEHPAFSQMAGDGGKTTAAAAPAAPVDAKAAAAAAAAQQPAKPAMPFNPLFPIQDDDSFNAVAKSFHRMPLNDPQLEFDILLPKDWTAEQTLQAQTASDLDRKILGDLAYFKSPIMGTLQAIVTIQAVRLDREISAENWLKSYVLQNGYAIQGKIVPVNEKKANVNCISTSEGSSNYIYATAEINGNNAIIVRFESPLIIKDQLEFLRHKVVDSFRFILTGDRPIETQKNYALGEALKFNYPVSWTINDQDSHDPNNVSMQLFSQATGDQVTGMIRFIATKRNADTSFRKEVNKLRAYFDGFLNLDFKKLVSSDKMQNAPSRFLFSRYEVYQVAAKKENAAIQELRLIALGDKDWYIFIFLLSPSDTENFYTWATNTQAFDIITRKLY